jgi:hypothetical protein
VPFLRKQKDITTAFFFCNSHQGAGDKFSEIIRTLVLQILRTHQDLTSHVFNEYVSQSSAVSVPELKKLFPELVAVISPVRIVIDGLDECTERDQKLILKDICSLLSMSGGRCKILISSRDCPHIRKALYTKPKISLTEKKADVDADIRQYVSQELSDLRERFDCQIIDKAEQRIADKAKGRRTYPRNRKAFNRV